MNNKKNELQARSNRGNKMKLFCGFNFLGSELRSNNQGSSLVSGLTFASLRDLSCSQLLINNISSVFSYSSSKPGSLEGIRWQSIERRFKKRDNEKAI